MDEKNQKEARKIIHYGVKKRMVGGEANKRR